MGVSANKRISGNIKRISELICITVLYIISPVFTGGKRNGKVGVRSWGACVALDSSEEQ